MLVYMYGELCEIFRTTNCYHYENAVLPVEFITCFPAFLNENRKVNCRDNTGVVFIEKIKKQKIKRRMKCAEKSVTQSVRR